MNIALTGSSGLIGSILANDLKALGHKVLCVSSSRSVHKQNIFSYEEVISGKVNITADCILHLASINSDLGQSEIDEEVDLCEKVIKLMKVVNCKNMIFFSSIKVYGANSFKEKKFSEESVLDPECSYGTAKKICEEVIIKKASLENFNYTILRLPPILIKNSSSNLGKLFYVVEKGLPIPLFQLGKKNQRSVLSYDLLKFSIKFLLDNQFKFKNQTFNVAEPESLSTNELIMKIGIILNKKPKIFYLPSFLFHIMMRVNRLQLMLCRIYGNFNVSSEKFRNTFF